MKALLIYYTGTYNTRFLTDKVAEKFAAVGIETDRVEINIDAPLPDTSGYDYIGFGYPIYGFNAPRPFVKYIKKLHFSDGQKYFIYKNSGETFAANNSSSRKIHRLLKRSNGVFCGEYHFVMPYNIHFEFDPAFIKELIYFDKKLLDVMTADIINGTPARIKTNIIYTISAFFVGIQALGGNINSFFYKVDKDKCTKCGLCVRNCPEKNISIKNGKVKFSYRCDMCMRCSFYCPEKAITIGFLNSWLVHDYYNLQTYWSDDSLPERYITEESSGFYKCFISYFKDIDKRFYEHIPQSENEEPLQKIV